MSESFLSARGLPSRDALSTRPHGTRLRYLSGCRCVPCRAANSRYECERAAARRAGDWRGLVDAAPVRKHLKKLRRRKIGYKAAASAAGVSASVVLKVLTGERQRVRGHTARRVLAVDASCRSDAVVVSASKTWRLITRLLAEGYTKARIAQELGARTPGLQLGRRRVLAITESKVERLYRRLVEV